MHEACMGLLFGKVKARHLQVEPYSHLLGPYSLALLSSTAPAPVGLTQPPDSARARVRPLWLCSRLPRQLPPTSPNLQTSRGLGSVLLGSASVSLEGPPSPVSTDDFFPTRPRAPARLRLPHPGLLASSQPPGFIPTWPHSFLAPSAMHVFCMAMHAASNPIPVSCRRPGSSALFPLPSSPSTSYGLDLRSPQHSAAPSASYGLDLNSPQPCSRPRLLFPSPCRLPSFPRLLPSACKSLRFPRPCSRPSFCSASDQLHSTTDFPLNLGHAQPLGPFPSVMNSTMHMNSALHVNSAMQALCNQCSTRDSWLQLQTSSSAPTAAPWGPSD